MKKYSHSDFVKHLGGDYREYCRRHFVSLGVIKETQELTWLSPNHPEYTHNGSDANYILWKVVDKNLLIVSVLAPKSETSPPHNHPQDPYPVVEKYACLYGEYDLLLDGTPRKIKVGERFDVLPGVKHKVKTNGSWALVAIVMENGGLYPPDQLHRR